MSEPVRVVMFKPQFAPLVEAGTKRQTIRPTPKRPIPVGRMLSLREWRGKPYRSKHRLLREARCTRVCSVRLGHNRARNGPEDRSGMMVAGRELVTRRHDDECYAFAKADGFACMYDMLRWFEKTHGLPFEGVLLKWGEEAAGE